MRVRLVQPFLALAVTSESEIGELWAFVRFSSSPFFSFCRYGGLCEAFGQMLMMLRICFFFSLDELEETNVSAVQELPI